MKGMQTQYRLGIRITAMIVVVAFCVTSVFTDAWAFVSGDATVLVESGLDATLAEFNSDAFSLPKSLGTVKERRAGTDETSGRTVIHIQDAHCNYGAQKSIANIIQHVSDTYGAEVINLEGGKGEYDLSAFREISNVSVREQTADFFVKEGVMNGAEYFAAGDDDAFLWGIENTDLYIANLEAYRKSLTFKDAADACITYLNVILNRFKIKMFSDEMIEVDTKYAQYKTSTISFHAYMEFLMHKAKALAINIKAYPDLYFLFQSLELENEINFKRANTERELLIDYMQKILSRNELTVLVEQTVAFKEKTISEEDFYAYLVRMAGHTAARMEDYPDLQTYLRYVALYRSADKGAVMSQIDQVENAIKDVLCTTAAQRELDTLSKNLVLLGNMFGLAFTREDYDYYVKNSTSFEVDKYTTFIDTYAQKYDIEPEPNPQIGQLDTYRLNMFEFYKYSFERDDAFIKNLRFSKNSSPRGRDSVRPVILLTGGFHTMNLSEKFKAEGVSYVSIMPNFKNPDGYVSPYFDNLAGQGTGIIGQIKEEMSALAVYSYLCENAEGLAPLTRDDINEIITAVAALISDDAKPVELKLSRGDITLLWDGEQVVVEGDSAEVELATKDEDVEFISKVSELLRTVLTKLMPGKIILMALFTVALVFGHVSPNWASEVVRSVVPFEQQETVATSLGVNEDVVEVESISEDEEWLIQKFEEFDFMRNVAGEDGSKVIQDSLHRSIERSIGDNKVAQERMARVDKAYEKLREMKLWNHQEQPRMLFLEGLDVNGFAMAIYAKNNKTNDGWIVVGTGEMERVPKEKWDEWVLVKIVHEATHLYNKEKHQEYSPLEDEYHAYIGTWKCVEALEGTTDQAKAQERVAKAFGVLIRDGSIVEICKEFGINRQKFNRIYYDDIRMMPEGVEIVLFDQGDEWSKSLRVQVTFNENGTENLIFPDDQSLAEGQDSYEDMRVSLEILGFSLTKENHEWFKDLDEDSQKIFLEGIKSEGFKKFVFRLRESSVYRVDESVHKNKPLELFLIYRDDWKRELLWTDGFKEFAKTLHTVFHLNPIDGFNLLADAYNVPESYQLYMDPEIADTLRDIETVFGKFGGTHAESLKDLAKMKREGLLGSVLYKAKSLQDGLGSQFSGFQEVDNIFALELLLEMNDKDRLEMREALLSPKAKNVYRILIDEGFIEKAFSFGAMNDINHFGMFVMSLDENEIGYIETLKKFDITKLTFNIAASFGSLSPIWQKLGDTLTAAQQPEIIDFYNTLKAHNPEFSLDNDVSKLHTIIEFYRKTPKKEKEDFFILAKQLGTGATIDDLKKNADGHRFSLKFYEDTGGAYADRGINYLAVDPEMYDWLNEVGTQKMLKVLLSKYQLKPELGKLYRELPQSKIGNYKDFAKVIARDDFASTVRNFENVYGYGNKDRLELLGLIYAERLYDEKQEMSRILLSEKAISMVPLFKMLSARATEKPIAVFELDSFFNIVNHPNGKAAVVALIEGYGFSNEIPGKEIFFLSSAIEKMLDDEVLRTRLLDSKNQDIYNRHSDFFPLYHQDELESFLQHIPQVKNLDEKIELVKSMGVKMLFANEPYGPVAKLLNADQYFKYFEPNSEESQSFRKFVKLVQELAKSNTQLKVQELLYLSQLYEDLSPEDIEFIGTEEFQEISQIMAKDFYIAEFRADRLRSMIAIAKNIDFDAVKKLKEELDTTVVANDIYLLNTISKNEELKRLVTDRTGLLSKLSSVYDNPPVIRELYGRADISSPDTERPDLDSLDTMALLRLYLLNKSLQNDGFVDEIGKVLNEDIFNNTTELGGYFYLGSDGSLHVMNVESISEDDGSYSNNLDAYLAGGLMPWHLHALGLDEHIFAGPSLGDLKVARKYGSMGVVFTSLGLTNDGTKIKFNVNMFYYDAKKDESRTIDIGVKEAHYDPINYPDVKFGIKPAHIETVDGGSYVGDFHLPTVKESLKIDLKKSGYNGMDEIKISIKPADNGTALSVSINNGASFKIKNLTEDRDKIRKAIRNGLKPETHLELETSSARNSLFPAFDLVRGVAGGKDIFGSVPYYSGTYGTGKSSSTDSDSSGELKDGNAERVEYLNMVYSFDVQDPIGSMRSGAVNLASLGRVVDAAFSNVFAEFQRGSIAARYLRVFSYIPIALHIGMLQHELFGHGAVGRRESLDMYYLIPSLKEYYPAGAGAGFEGTPFDLYMFKDVVNKDRRRYIVFKAGGIEATQVLAREVRMGISRSGGTVGAAILYAVSKKDISTYIFCTPESLLFNYSGKIGNDIVDYYELMHYEYGDDIGFNYQDLKNGAVWNLMDPTLFLSLYHAFINYPIFGKETFNLYNGLPYTGFHLTPLGPVYSLGFYAAERMSKSIFYPSISVTKSSEGLLPQAGLEFVSPRIGNIFTFDASVDVWQNEAGAVDPVGFALGGGVEVVLPQVSGEEVNISLLFGGGVKTTGYSLGRGREPGPWVNAGIRIETSLLKEKSVIQAQHQEKFVHESIVRKRSHKEKGKVAEKGYLYEGDDSVQMFNERHPAVYVWTTTNTKETVDVPTVLRVVDNVVEKIGVGGKNKLDIAFYRDGDKLTVRIGKRVNNGDADEIVEIDKPEIRKNIREAENALFDALVKVTGGRTEGELKKSGISSVELKPETHPEAGYSTVEFLGLVSASIFGALVLYRMLAPGITSVAISLGFAMSSFLFGTFLVTQINSWLTKNENAARSIRDETMIEGFSSQAVRYAAELYDMETVNRLSFRNMRSNFKKLYAKESKKDGIKFNLSQTGLFKEGSIRYYPFSFDGEEYAIRIFNNLDKEYVHQTEVLSEGGVDENLSYEIISRTEFDRVIVVKNLPLQIYSFAGLAISMFSLITLGIYTVFSNESLTVLESISFFLQVNLLFMLVASFLITGTQLFHYLSRAREVPRYVGKTPVPEGKFDVLPKVTIQLPTYNEANVIESLIASACAVDYPRDKLEIQIVDDSTDQTVEIIERIVEQRKTEGYNIKHIRRPVRTGYKGGALLHATKLAEGDFVAIFDADFIIPEDFFTRTIHHFANPKIGVVQGTWGFSNENESLLTKLQTLSLSIHQLIDQTMKNRKGYYINFQGTAGVWRKEAIEKAGGWQFDTVIEDADLSYNAQLAGYEFVYLDDLAALSELPREVTAYKSQQARWTKGGAQVLRKVLPRIWKSDASLGNKIEITIKLTMSLSAIPTMLIYLLIVPSFWVAKNIGVEFLYTSFVLVNFAATSYASRKILKTAHMRYNSAEYKANSFLENTKNFCAMTALGMAMTVVRVKATIEAIFDRESVFIRTPKEGDRTQSKKHYQVSKDIVMATIEILMGLYAVVMFAKGIYCSSVISVFIYPQLASAFLWLGIVTLKEKFQKNKASVKASDRAFRNEIASRLSLIVDIFAYFGTKIRPYVRLATIPAVLIPVFLVGVLAVSSFPGWGKVTISMFVLMFMPALFEVFIASGAKESVVDLKKRNTLFIFGAVGAASLMPGFAGKLLAAELGRWSIKTLAQSPRWVPFRMSDRNYVMRTNVGADNMQNVECVLADKGASADMVYDFRYGDVIQPNGEYLSGELDMTNAVINVKMQVPEEFARPGLNAVRIAIGGVNTQHKYASQYSHWVSVPSGAREIDLSFSPSKDSSAGSYTSPGFDPARISEMKLNFALGGTVMGSEKSMKLRIKSIKIEGVSNAVPLDKRLAERPNLSSDYTLEVNEKLWSDRNNPIEPVSFRNFLEDSGISEYTEPGIYGREMSSKDVGFFGVAGKAVQKQYNELDVLRKNIARRSPKLSNLKFTDRRMLFTDFRMGFEHDGKLKQNFDLVTIERNLKALVSLARKHKIKLKPVVFDFGFFKDHPEILLDIDEMKSFIARMKPIFKMLGKKEYRDVIVALEPVNEPDVDLNQTEPELVSGVCKFGRYKGKYMYVPIEARQKFVELCADSIRDNAPGMPLSFSSVSIELLKYWTHLVVPENGDELNAHYYTKFSYTDIGVRDRRDIFASSCDRRRLNIDERVKVFIGEFQPSKRDGTPIAGKVLKEIRKSHFSGGLLWNVSKDFLIGDAVMKDFERAIVQMSQTERVADRVLQKTTTVASSGSLIGKVIGDKGIHSGQMLTGGFRVEQSEDGDRVKFSHDDLSEAIEVGIDSPFSHVNVFMLSKKLNEYKEKRLEALSKRALSEEEKSWLEEFEKRINSIIAKFDDINNVINLKPHDQIKGHFGEDGVLYLNGDLRKDAMKGNPLALIHELGEEFVDLPEEYPNLTRHTFMRGVGKDIRKLVNEMVENDSGLKEGLSCDNVDVLISALNSEIWNRKLAEDGEMVRGLTKSEKALIRYNADVVLRNKENKKYSAEMFLYGIQDYLDHGGNLELTAKIKDMKPKKRDVEASVESVDKKLPSSEEEKEDVFVGVSGVDGRDVVVEGMEQNRSENIIGFVGFEKASIGKQGLGRVREIVNGIEAYPIAEGKRSEKNPKTIIMGNSRLELIEILFLGMEVRVKYKVTETSGKEYIRESTFVPRNRDTEGNLIFSVGRGRLDFKERRETDKNTNDIILTDGTVSKKHAEIYVSPMDGSFFVMDRGSRNGTKCSFLTLDPVLKKGQTLRTKLVDLAEKGDVDGVVEVIERMVEEQRFLARSGKVYNYDGYRPFVADNIVFVGEDGKERIRCLDTFNAMLRVMSNEVKDEDIFVDLIKMVVKIMPRREDSASKTLKEAARIVSKEWRRQRRWRAYSIKSDKMEACKGIEKQKGFRLKENDEFKSKTGSREILVFNQDYDNVFRNFREDAIALVKKSNEKHRLSEMEKTELLFDYVRTEIRHGVRSKKIVEGIVQDYGENVYDGDSGKEVMKVKIGSFIKKRQGVCRHKAPLLHYLLRDAGIESLLKRGPVIDEDGEYLGRHVWLEVFVDGKGYRVDPTWGDISMYLESSESVDENRGGRYTEEWSKNKNDLTVEVVEEEYRNEMKALNVAKKRLHEFLEEDIPKTTVIFVPEDETRITEEGPYEDGGGPGEVSMPQAVPESGENVGDMIDNVRRSCLNIILVRSPNIEMMQGQEKWARKGSRKFRKRGINTRVTHYDEDLLDKLKEAVAIANKTKNRVLFPKIAVHCLTETDVEQVRIFRTGLLPEEQKMLAIVKDLVGNEENVENADVNEMEVIAISALLLNDKRLRDDFAYPKDDAQLLAWRQKLLSFLGEKIDGIDLDNMEPDDYETLMQKIFNGDIGLMITKVDIDEEFSQWEIAQDAVLRSL